MASVRPLRKTGAGRALVRRRAAARTRRRAAAFYLFIAPWLLGLVLLQVVPLILGFLTSLTNYDGLNLGDVKFVGLRNYSRAFSDPDMSFALGRTALWCALNTPLWLALAFGLALLLNQDIRGRSFFRTLYYLPSVVPVVASVWVWRIFLDANNGLLNGIIGLLRPGTAIAWLSGYALPSLTAVSLWTGLGAGMVIFLAGLQGIPAELEEAARIDGAGRWQVLRHVILPLLSPVIFFQLILGLINALQALVIPLLLATSGSQVGVPPRAVYLYMVHTYRQIFAFQRFGYGMALIWLLIVVILALTLLVFRTARYWVYYEVEVEGGDGGGRG
jgi:multiple sugar transport system permease protein